MKVKNLSFSYNQKSFIKDLNIEFKENQITTIIGSNGSGKSTLLMLLSRIYKPQTGFIEINQQDIQNYKIKEFAQKVAVVHQFLYSLLEVYRYDLITSVVLIYHFHLNQ